MRIVNTAIAVATGAVITLGSLVAGQARATDSGYSIHHTQPMAVPRWMTRPCAEEDSVNCYWDAQTMGNGRGHSFYVRRMPGDITGLTCWTYVQRKFGANHDHCEPRS